MTAEEQLEESIRQLSELLQWAHRERSPLEAIVAIRKAKNDAQTRLALLKIKDFWESQAVGDFDPELSQRLDCIEQLLS